MCARPTFCHKTLTGSPVNIDIYARERETSLHLLSTTRVVYTLCGMTTDQSRAFLFGSSPAFERDFFIQEQGNGYMCFVWHLYYDPIGRGDDILLLLVENISLRPVGLFLFCFPMDFMSQMSLVSSRMTRCVSWVRCDSSLSWDSEWRICQGIRKY
jgi:hypothetical protein